MKKTRGENNLADINDLITSVDSCAIQGADLSESEVRLLHHQCQSLDQLRGTAGRDRSHRHPQGLSGIQCGGLLTCTVSYPEFIEQRSKCTCTFGHNVLFGGIFV